MRPALALNAARTGPQLGSSDLLELAATVGAGPREVCAGNKQILGLLAQA